VVVKEEDDGFLAAQMVREATRQLRSCGRMRRMQWGSQFGGGRLASSGDERRSELPWWKMTTQAAPMA
jgi:hypothetical protein